MAQASPSNQQCRPSSLIRKREIYHHRPGHLLQHRTELLPSTTPGPVLQLNSPRRHHRPNPTPTVIPPFASSIVRTNTTVKMFRTAVLRSAASAAARRSVVATTSRSFSSVVSRPALASKAVAPISRVASWTTVRCYAAGSGLSKEDVEGRITSLLAGFDKVRSPQAMRHRLSLMCCNRTGNVLWASPVLLLRWWSGLGSHV